MSLWVILALMILGAAAILLEVFVPAGGLLGVGGLALVVVGIVQGYRNLGPEAGAVLLAASLVVIPTVLYVALRLFPNSWVGRKLILRESQRTDEGFVSYTENDYRELVGCDGEALTTLRPSGMVRVGEKKYSVVTAGEYVQRGDPVRVIRTEGSRIVVARMRSPAGEGAGGTAGGNES